VIIEKGFWRNCGKKKMGKGREEKGTKRVENGMFKPPKFSVPAPPIVDR